MKIPLRVNGHDHDVDVEPSALLADVLRDDCRMTSVHLGCEHGVCGACNVLVDGEVVRACLTLAVPTAGREVVTLEGLNDPLAGRLKQAFCQHHALQCGFCTPGMVVTGYHLLRQQCDWDEAGIRQRLAGNICRCTGYQGIVAAIGAVAAEPEPTPLETIE